MTRSMTKKTGFIPGIVLMLCLLTMTVSANVEATTVTTEAVQGTQIAWWGHGGYYGGGYRGAYYGGYGYHRGYYGGGGYNRYYYRPAYNGARCHKQCWRDRWNRVRCNTRCYY